MEEELGKTASVADSETANRRLPLGISRNVMFERAMAVMQNEWRRFKLERTEWEVERIKLKAKLSASEKRIAQLSSLYNISQRHIKVLEGLLKEARSGSNNSKPQKPETQPLSAIRSPENNKSASVDVEEIVATTANTREKSKMLLARCLAEIEALIGKSSNASYLQSSLGTPSNSTSNTHLSTDQPAVKAGNGQINELALPNSQIQQLTTQPFKTNCNDDNDNDNNDNDGKDSPIEPDTASTEFQLIDDIVRGLAVDELDASSQRQVTPAIEQSVSEWRLSKTFIGHLDMVRSISMRHNPTAGPQILSGSDDGIVALWDVEKNERRRQSSRRRPINDVLPSSLYRGHLAAVTCVAFKESHEHGYSGSLDSTIKIWALPEDSQTTGPSLPCFPLHSLEGHQDAVWDIAVMPERQILVSASADGTCRIWSTDLDSDSPLLKVLMYSKGALSSSTHVEATPTSVCFASDNDPQRAVVGFSNAYLGIFDTGTGVLISEIEGSSKVNVNSDLSITKVVSAGEFGVVAGYSDGLVKLFDARTKPHGAVAFNAYENGIAATGVAHSQRASLVITGGSDGSVKWWDVRNPGESIASVPAHMCKSDEGTCGVQCLESRGGGASEAPVVATCGADSLIKLYRNVDT